MFYLLSYPCETSLLTLRNSCRDTLPSSSLSTFISSSRTSHSPSSVRWYLVNIKNTKRFSTGAHLCTNKTFKCPLFYPFSDLCFSSSTPVVPHELMVQKIPEKSIISPLFTTSFGLSFLQQPMLCCCMFHMFGRGHKRLRGILKGCYTHLIGGGVANLEEVLCPL